MQWKYLVCVLFHYFVNIVLKKVDKKESLCVFDQYTVLRISKGVVYVSTQKLAYLDYRVEDIWIIYREAICCTHTNITKYKMTNHVCIFLT